MSVNPQPWAPTDRAAWLASRVKHRSYADDVLTRIDALRARYHGYRLHNDDAQVLAEVSSAEKIDALAERYALLARDGRPPQVPEAAYRAVAEAHFRRGEPKAGVALLQRAVAAYPWSVGSRQALADGKARLAK